MNYNKVERSKFKFKLTQKTENKILKSMKIKMKKYKTGVSEKG